MDFPFALIRVPGKDAPARLAELRASRQEWPVIVGNEDSLSQLADNLDEDGEPAEELIARATAIDPLAWLAGQAAEYDNEEPEEGEWPEDATPSDSLTGHLDVLSRKPHKEVAIALVPAAAPWMVPCHLRIGGWNACPDAEVHAALFKRWGELYGATVATIGGDTIEMLVERPPTTREEAMALAREQYWYCPDIVDQGTESLEVLAATLLNGKAWFFWWD